MKQRRTGYHEECATILRIHRRISEDKSRDPGWRAEMLKHLDQVVAGFNDDARKALLRGKAEDEKGVEFAEEAGSDQKTASQ